MSYNIAEEEAAWKHLGTGGTDSETIAKDAQAWLDR